MDGPPEIRRIVEFHALEEIDSEDPEFQEIRQGSFCLDARAEN